MARSRAPLAFFLLLASCGGEAVEKSPLVDHRYRAIAGVSMGAIGAGAMGAGHPEDFDAIAALGGPLHSEYFLHYLETHYLGGFCSLEELEDILRENPNDPEVLNDPERLPCMRAAEARYQAVFPERRQRYDHWAFGSNGGNFDRDAYLDLFEDLVLAYGNPLYPSDLSSPTPPGISMRDLEREDICQNPIVLPGVDHPELNPGGRYPLVTFCDGETAKPFCKDTLRPVDLCSERDPEAACAEEGGVDHASLKKNEALFLEKVGRFDPCGQQERVVSFALGVDVNENGRRDFGEPILIGNSSPGPGRANLLAADPGTKILEEWTDEQKRRMSFYLDGGIRDIFQFGIHASLLFDVVDSFSRGERFEGTSSFPGAPANEDAFFPLALTGADLPKNLLYLYGDPAASEAAKRAGDGDHVGTTRQVMNRLQLFLRWISLRWDGLEDPPADRSSFWSRAHSGTFPSPSLGGRERDYAVVLPPGYDDPANANTRYPVVFILHGYGQKAAGPGGFWESFLLTDGRMASGELRKMILVFPSGRCCFTHEVTKETVCTEEEGAAPGFLRECHSGSFYTQSPVTGRDYEGSVLDLMAFIDEHFRTLAPPLTP